MFIRVFFATAALFSISLFTGEKEAAACTIEPDGSLTLNNESTQVCRLDPERMTVIKPPVLPNTHSPAAADAD